MDKLKILIVDDEKIERNGMRFLFKQMGYDVELMEASNGRDAFEYLKTNKADILLTDIKMPFMDGLELINETIKLKPEMKIIIFSGHNDFEYAKKAIKSGVSDYILKPVDPKEFKSTMDKVIAEVGKEIEEKEVKEKSKQFLEEHLLYLAVNGTAEDTIKDIEKEASLRSGMADIVDINFVKRYTRLILIEFNSEFFGRYENFAEKLYQYYKSGIKYLNLNPQQAVVLLDETELLKDNEDTEQQKAALSRTIAENIYSIIDNHYMEKCFIAVSSSVQKDKMGGLKMALDEAEVLMENKFYQNGEHIFMESLDKNSGINSQINDDTLVKQMQQDIKMKDIEGLREHFSRFCDSYKNKTSFSQIYIKFIFSNLLKDFYASLTDMSEQEFNKEIEILYRSTSFSGLMDVINKNIERLEKAFAINPQMLHREIETIKEYIFGHYGEEISVEQLADMVYMAPSYLSSVFKKETGQNLSKFIKSYRMEKAKEMLENTHNKIVNISIAVGYPNVSYFCQSFREYFGVSPQKFRTGREE